MKVLITSGGCKVPIDDVRHIGNFSSGRIGSALAKEFHDKGHDVVFFCEKGSRMPDIDFGEYRRNIYGEIYSPIFKSYRDYWEYLGVKELVKKERPDIIISAAAIADYVMAPRSGKISSDNETMTLNLVKGEKVIQSFRELAPYAFIVGFKLLVKPTPKEKAGAILKQMDYVDAIVYNDLMELRRGNLDREYVRGWNTESGKTRRNFCGVYDLVTKIIEDSK